MTKIRDLLEKEHLIEHSSIKKRIGLNINLDLIKICIFLFTFCLSTIHTFVSSVIYYLILLFIIVFLLVSNLLLNRTSIIITKVDIFWIGFLLIFLLNNLMITDITGREIIDILVYISCFIFLILIKANIVQFKSSLKLIKLLAIIYALSAIFQYLSRDLYMNIILPLFSGEEQLSILRLLSYNSYTGFTNQPAHLAGYIINGIGILFFSFKLNSKFFKKIIFVIIMGILLFGLILASKRAHIIFMILSLIITYLCSSENKEILLRIFKISTSIIVGFLSIILLFSIFQFKSDSPIMFITNQITETIIGIVNGEDVSNGRSILYKNSLELFAENPIFGAGWREFGYHSIGLISQTEGSQSHNIYIQLLSELGMIGFLLFIIPLLYTYFKSIKMLKLVVNNKKTSNIVQLWKMGLQYSLYSQTFFILYGMTGNLLTDYNFLLMYFFACSITISATVYLREKNL